MHNFEWIQKAILYEYVSPAAESFVPLTVRRSSTVWLLKKKQQQKNKQQQQKTKNKHNAELQQTDPGTKVTGEFSTRGYIITPKFNMPRVLIVKTIYACDGAQPCCSSFTFAIFCEVP